METLSEQAFKPEAVITGVQGPWTWILLLLWPAVPEHVQAFAPQHRGMDIWLLIHGCLEDTVSAQVLGPQDTALDGIPPFPRQSCPLRLSEHSAVFYKKLLQNNTYDSEGFSANSVYINCKIWVVKKLPAVSAVTVKLYIKTLLSITKIFPLYHVNNENRQMSAIKGNHLVEVSCVWWNEKYKLFPTPPAIDYLIEKSQNSNKLLIIFPYCKLLKSLCKCFCFIMINISVT